MIEYAFYVGTHILGRKSGPKVMKITFDDFDHFSKKNWQIFLKTNCSDKGYDDFKGLFQLVEYIHRRTQMITAGVAVAVTFYRIESSAL
jgi:hypothetical protein